jgi:hypothetical protein
MSQLNDPNDLNLSREIFTPLDRFLFFVYLGLRSRPRRGFHWDDPNLLTFEIFFLKKFLLACGTKGSLAVLGCETCVINISFVSWCLSGKMLNALMLFSKNFRYMNLLYGRSLPGCRNLRHFRHHHRLRDQGR